jgi:4-hydroxy-tetrahydrodipicolinate synthase
VLSDLSARLQSVVVISVTPFDDRGHIDLAAYADLIRRLVNGGISVITPNGGVGEFYSLSDDEASRLLETVVSIAGGRALLIPGVGHDLASAIGAARRAEGMGAEAVMIHPPAHPHRSEDGWVAYHREIADAVPRLGLVLYLRDGAIRPRAIRSLLETAPNVVAVKYAVADPTKLAEMIQEVGQGRLTWLCGLAELWAPFFWIAGARGFTSGLANVRPELPLEMLARLREDNYRGAMDVWQQVHPFETMRARHDNANNVPVVKEALAVMGICSRRVRPPLNELIPSEREELSDVVNAWRGLAIDKV